MSCVSTASCSSHEDTANGLQTEMTRSILKLKTVSKRLGIDELTGFSDAWLRVCGFLYKLASFNRGEIAFCAFAAGCGADDGRSAPRRKFDEQGVTLPLGGDRQEQGLRQALMLEEVAKVLEPQIQVSVLERIDEEIVEVTKQ